ncbi:MAG: hypothetical protein GXO35_02235, partial [Gammaproteobacteria bacterium]|nr:hypothetical protein [Gammaproteobacteria bacterium]
MRWIKRLLALLLILLLLLLVSLVLGGFFIQKQLSDANIKITDWQLDTLSLTSLRLSQLELIHRPPVPQPKKPIIDPLNKTYEPFKNVNYSEDTQK